MAGGETMIQKPKFYATVNLGQILAIVTCMGAGMKAYTGIHVSIAELQIELQHSAEHLSSIDTAIEKLREVLLHSDGRLSTMEASTVALETDVRHLQEQVRALNMHQKGDEQ